MEIRFWSNKDYVEDWLNNLKGFNYKFSVNTIGKGHKGVELYVFDIEDIELFMKEYGRGKSAYAEFYLTRSMYTKGSPFYVSIKKK